MINNKATGKKYARMVHNMKVSLKMVKKMVKGN